MKNQWLIILIFIATIGCESCDKGDPDKVDKNTTYTWQGTIYKGMGEAVWANAPLTLVGTYSEGYHLNETVELATGFTDSAGRYYIEYQWDSAFNFPADAYIDLQCGNSVLTNGYPWNMNINKDLCTRDHESIKMIIEDNRVLNKDDTLYLLSFLFGKTMLIDGDVQIFKFVENSTGGNKDGYFITPINDSVLSILNEFTGQYDNSPFLYELYYTTTRPGSTLNDYENLKEVVMEWRGFPYIDTVTIVLED